MKESVNRVTEAGTSRPRAGPGLQQDKCGSPEHTDLVRCLLCSPVSPLVSHLASWRLSVLICKMKVTALTVKSVTVRATEETLLSGRF